MEPMPVVEPLDIPETVCPRLLVALPEMVAYTFALQAGKEALHWGIVPTVATAVHAPFDAGCA